MALQFFTTSNIYFLYSSVQASSAAMALAATTCCSAPPCIPGKTEPSTCFASSCVQNIMPPRGPRRVLCVVVVTMSA